MSFRLRVLALVALVATSATGATAWLTLREASQQINDFATADEAQIEKVTTRLREYGLQHGTWEQVSELVWQLHQETGQRIHLRAESGTVIADSDNLRAPNRAVRPLGAASSSVNPRPVLSVTGPLSDASETVLQLLPSYRQGVRLAACLTRFRLSVVAHSGTYGVPMFWPGPAEPQKKGLVEHCQRQAVDPDRDAQEDATRIAACNVPEQLPDCLARAFTDRISGVAPVPAQVYLGVRGQPSSPLAVAPLLAVAAGVAAVTIIGTVLISRRVLRPIDTLTAAAGRLGRGDLSSRVPVRGRDELAELGRAFNRMADSLQQAEERQRRLVADVAHELRTPLVNLRGYLEALADGVIVPEAELFASLHEEALLQQRVVDDLQTLALAEAGVLAYHWSSIDVPELLETCRTAHKGLAKSAGVSLEVASEPCTVWADPDRLRQVIGNLLTNALRATSKGGTVTLRATRPDAMAVIEVADTGSGIAAKDLPHVFDRLWRADPARGRYTGGSGLGLAITQQIVRHHGGRIAVSSELGVGTTFTITLPAVSGDGDAWASGRTTP
ncbi:MAG TPA: ATP-binding protein [Micromonosporaceae bacterium]|nr:ATP-binding protein [Micromonosporaceae bacterium]